MYSRLATQHYSGMNMVLCMHFLWGNLERNDIHDFQFHGGFMLIIVFIGRFLTNQLPEALEMQPLYG